MTKLKQLAERRRNRKQYYHNGVWLPQDRRQWTDDMERELLKSVSYWR